MREIPMGLKSKPLHSWNHTVLGTFSERGFITEINRFDLTIIITQVLATASFQLDCSSA